MLHDEEVDTLLTANVVERADVGMRERRDGFCLALEAVAQRCGRVQRRREDLDGDMAIEANVLRAVDLAHAPRAKKGNDFVRAEPGSG